MDKGWPLGDKDPPFMEIILIITWYDFLLQIINPFDFDIYSWLI